MAPASLNNDRVIMHYLGNDVLFGISPYMDLDNRWPEMMIARDQVRLVAGSDAPSQGDARFEELSA